MSDWKLISTANPSGAANVEFTALTGYKIFKWVFIDVNPVTDNVKFQFNGSDDASSHTYDITKTTTYFDAQHKQDGNYGALNYKTSHDLAQSTGYQSLGYELGNGGDECLAGELHLFNPASTTYVKHFYYVGNYYQNTEYTLNPYVAGYFNTTSAITALNFKMDSGNFDGVIKQYGLVEL
jgi:hypothetical protein